MKRRYSNRAAALAFATAVLAIAPRARGDGASDEALVKRGLELRRRGEDAEALRVFEQAYAARPTPRVRAQMALAQHALGMWIEAEAGLVAALAATGDPWIARNRAPLESSLASVRKRLAWLEVAVNVPDARFFANGVEVRIATGQPARVVAGVVVLEVRADGYEPVQRRLDIPSGGSAREVVTLARVATTAPPLAAPPPSTASPAPASPAPASPAPASPAPASPASSVAPSPFAPPQREAPPTTGDARRTVAWIAAGSAVVLLGTGIVADVVRENDASVYLDDSRCYYGTLSREQRCGSYRQSAMTVQWIGVGAYAGAGVAALVSVYLFATASHADTTDRRAGAVQMQCGPMGAGVTCGGTF
jgi:hypothetical protein